MHRLVAFLLVCLYLPAALNATVTAHYCMGKLTGVDVTSSAPASNVCRNCSMVKKDQKGCCHDKKETLTLNKDQVSSSAMLIAAPFISLLQRAYFSIPVSLYTLRAIGFPSAHSPPLIAVSPLVLYCIFRI